MDDRFLHELRRDPPPQFARALRERLRDEPESAPSTALRPVLAGAVALAAITLFFVFPSVRAWGQAMLDLFRVRNFAVVTFQPSRLEKLRAQNQDNAFLIFDRHEKIQDPGEPTIHATPQAAGAVAGLSVEVPSYLPSNLKLERVMVQGEARGRLGISGQRLRALLESLDLRDVEVPAGLDGQELTVHLYPVVGQEYRSEKRKLGLLQARSPEVTLPPGADLQRLAEIGLRILGLEAGEARRMAGSIDWRSTLLVPVPANAGTFREVLISGNKGLLVTTTEPKGQDGQRRRAGTIVLWTKDDRVFALRGDLEPRDMVQVAESVR